LAIPKEFGGPDSGFSPEDLFALAAANCFIATFKVVAERSRLEFRELQVEALLTVDRGPDGAPWMSDLLLRVRLEGASDQERGLRLLEKTSKSCLVLNSLKTRVEFSFEASA
jgi:organic hydroperoxide reductase OsmC/OhrA